MNKALICAYNKGYRVKNNVIFFKKRVIKGSISKGYKIFTIRMIGYNGCIPVHRLVAYQKYGDKIFEPGMQVRHLDSNKLNNKYKNITIGTAKENASDKSHEVVRRAVLIAASVWKKHDHKKILEARKNGCSYKEIMKRFNITSKGTLSFIINKSLDKQDTCVAQ